MRRTVGFPNDVQDDILKRGIPVVAVGAPTAGPEVNFHVTRTRRIVADLHERIAKIRPALDVGKTGMKHADAPPVQCHKLVAPQSLMLPDDLQQALRGRVRVVAQEGRDTAPDPPLRVKRWCEARSVRWQTRRGEFAPGTWHLTGFASHLSLLLRGRFCRVKYRTPLGKTTWSDAGSV